jgi:hypothetical protein
VQHDQLDISGTVKLNGAVLELSGNAVVPATGLVILTNGGTDAIVGTFANLSEGDIVTLNGQPLTISYVGGTGNDVALFAVPLDVTIANGGKTATFRDVDGDLVTVKTTVGAFEAGDFTGLTLGPNNQGQLQSLNLDAGFAGSNISIVATRTTTGDGFVNIGQIDATGVDLGTVAIDGDLGLVRAGDGTVTTPGLKGLTAHSMGRFGTSTGLGGLTSNIQGRLGFLRIKTDVKDVSIQVGSGADGDIGPVSIGGSLIGGGTDDSGHIRASNDIGIVTIKGDVIGATGSRSASVTATTGRIAGLTIGGSLQGGTAVQSGRIFSAGPMGPVKITGNLIGNSVVDSGRVVSQSSLASVTIGGDLIGGAGFQSGQITSAGSMGPVRITGNVIGGAGNFSGQIDAGDALSSVTIGGDLQGGDGIAAGHIFSSGAMGAVKIAGDVLGGAGAVTGNIGTFGALASLTIGGDVIGGSGVRSGGIESAEKMGPVKITGNVIGGGGDNSGAVFAGALPSVSIGGDVQGGAGDFSGRITSFEAIGSLKITGNVIGGSASAGNLVQSGYIQGKRIGTLTIGGALIAGTDNTAGNFVGNGAIQVLDDIGSLTIGNIIGNATNPALISARGKAVQTTTDLAIGKLTVKGRVEFAQILAGFDLAGAGVNADAQIGPVTVGGDWIASSLVAGADATNGKFGDGDDAKIAGGNAAIVSKIVSLTIGGQALGTVGGTDHFGIVAESVGLVKVRGTLIPTTAGNGNDDIAVGITDDFKLNEI